MLYLPNSWALKGTRVRGAFSLRERVFGFRCAVQASCPDSWVLQWPFCFDDRKEDSPYLYPIFSCVDFLEFAQTGNAVELIQRVIDDVEMGQIRRCFDIAQRLDFVVAHVQLDEIFELGQIADRSKLHVIAADGEKTAKQSLFTI